MCIIVLHLHNIKVTLFELCGHCTRVYIYLLSCPRDTEGEWLFSRRQTQRREWPGLMFLCEKSARGSEGRISSAPMPGKVVSTCTTIHSNAHATRHNLPAVFNLILYLYRCLSSSLKSALAASIHFSFAIAVLGKAALANAEHGAGPGGCTGSVSQLFNDAICGYFDLVIDLCCSECIAV